MKPEITFKNGSARAAIFLNRNRNGDSGQEFSSYSVNVHRRFEESPGVWKSTSYFRFFELPQVALVLQLATQYVAEREAQQHLTSIDSSESSPNESASSSDAAA